MQGLHHYKTFRINFFALLSSHTYKNLPFHLNVQFVEGRTTLNLFFLEGRTFSLFL